MQTQITKPAAIVEAVAVAEKAKRPTRAKPAAEKATPAKAAKAPAVKSAKPTKATKKATAQKVSATAAKYFIHQGTRPASGKLLQAHTEAALQFFGMYDGAQVAKKELVKVMGATAVAYHLGNATRNMIDTEGKISLTAIGRGTFTARQAGLDEKATAAYLSILKTGKADGNYVKNQDLIFAA